MIQNPEISIIIPTYARPERLAQCLDSVRLIKGVAFEVVVVDDGSPKPVDKITNKFKGQLNINYLRQENAGPASARNRGAQAAMAPCLAFTDDDCRPDANWLSALALSLKSQPDALVGGRTVNALDDNIYSESSQDLVSFLYEYANAKGADYDFFTSNNMACRAELFAALGGFDETFPLAAAEDRDFGLRWKAAGHPLIYEPAAVIRHAHHLTLRDFWRQQSNYGRGARHLRKRVAARAGDAVRFEGLQFYASMALFPYRHHRAAPLSRAALFGVSQVATAIGFFRESLHASRAGNA